MRSPERIKPFLEELSNQWEKRPDYRFGQLIFNMYKSNKDMFFCEDDEFLDMIKNYHDMWG